MESNHHKHQWVIEPVARDGRPLASILELDLGLLRQFDDTDWAEQLAPLPIIEW